MDERKMFILGAILQSYIQEGQPIGSRTLQRDYQMNVSAATIRNEMSDLEHMGFLEKAHTSSGRLPSEKALRWYVDELLRRGPDPEMVPALGSKSLLKQSQDSHHLISQVLSIMSDLTDSVSFALVPGRENDVLDAIRFIPLSGNEVMIVVVYRSKFVQTELIRLGADYGDARLMRIGEIFQELFEGRTLRSVADFLRSDYFSNAYIKGNLMSEIVPTFLERLESSRKPQLLFEGLGKWLRLGDAEQLPDGLNFLDALRSDPYVEEYLSSMSGERGVQVRIGRENTLPLFEQTAVIAVPYEVSGSSPGLMGIIGPMRMNYRQAIGYVQRMGRYLDSMTIRSS